MPVNIPGRPNENALNQILKQEAYWVNFQKRQQAIRDRLATISAVTSTTQVVPPETVTPPTTEVVEYVRPLISGVGPIQLITEPKLITLRKHFKSAFPIERKTVTSYSKTTGGVASEAFLRVPAKGFFKRPGVVNSLIDTHLGIRLPDEVIANAYPFTSLAAMTTCDYNAYEDIEVSLVRNPGEIDNDLTARLKAAVNAGRQDTIILYTASHSTAPTEAYDEYHDIVYVVYKGPYTTGEATSCKLYRSVMHKLAGSWSIFGDRTEIPVDTAYDTRGFNIPDSFISVRLDNQPYTAYMEWRHQEAVISALNWNSLNGNNTAVAKVITELVDNGINIPSFIDGYGIKYVVPQSHQTGRANDGGNSLFTYPPIKREYSNLNPNSYGTLDEFYTAVAAAIYLNTPGYVFRIMDVVFRVHGQYANPADPPAFTGQYVHILIHQFQGPWQEDGLPTRIQAGWSTYYRDVWNSATPSPWYISVDPTPEGFYPQSVSLHNYPFALEMDGTFTDQPVRDILDQEYLGFSLDYAVVGGVVDYDFPTDPYPITFRDPLAEVIEGGLTGSGSDTILTTTETETMTASVTPVEGNFGYSDQSLVVEQYDLVELSTGKEIMFGTITP